MAHKTELSPLDAYERHGEAWAKLRGNTLIERDWLDQFCAMLRPHAAVLDIGCGSGQPIASELFRRGFDITGVDGSSTMINLFRRNFPDAMAYLTDMRQLSLGKRYAGLIAWDSFFHLSPDEQRGMFARFQAHAVPGAALMFTSGPAQGSAVGNLEGDPLYHGSLNADEYRTLLEAAGFAVVAHIVEDPTCGGRTVWLARQL